MSKPLETLLNQLIEYGSSFGTKLLISALILIIGLKLAKQVVKWTEKILQTSLIDDSISSFILSIAKIGTKVIVFVMAIMQLGVASSAFVTLLASGGMAVGLALQGSLSNIASGFLILLLRPFQIGDYIKEDSHGNEGRVIGIGLFYTKISTVDKKTVLVPNGVITTSSLTNVTNQEMRMIDLRIGIAYEDDLRKAKEIMKRIAIEIITDVNEEEIQVFVDDLADSCVLLGLRVSVATDEYQPTRWALLERIKLAFDDEGIHIPYNQMDVHIIPNEI